jgi:hypothetical protein
MTNIDPPDDTTPDKENLLSDDDFSALMTAEYKASGSKTDEVAKQRVWEGVIGKVRDKESPKKNLKSWGLYGSGFAIAAALILFIVYSPVENQKYEPVDQFKGESTGIVPVSLSAFVLGADGLPSNFTPEQRKVGAKLIFKSTATQDAFVSLIKVEAGGLPNIVSISQPATAGQEIIVEKDGQVYGYALQETNVTFCVLAYSTEQELNDALLEILQGQDYALEGSCLAF